MNKNIIITIIGLILLSGISVNAINTMKASNDNHAPNPPTIIGPSHVKPGVKNKWIFYSTDPDGDNITYYIDWGDKCGGAEWHGPFPSGEKVEIAHTYALKNTLIITSLAIDEKYAESNWTNFEISIPRNRSINPIFMYLFDRFTNIYQIIRNLLIL